MSGTEQQPGTPPNPPGTEVDQGLRNLELTAGPAPGTEVPPGGPAPGAEPLAEQVDWEGMLREGFGWAKDNTAWVYPDKATAMMVGGFAGILKRMPVEKAGALIEQAAPYLMAAGGLWLLVRANRETVEIDGEQVTRLRPIFKDETPPAAPPPRAP